MEIIEIIRLSGFRKWIHFLKKSLAPFILVIFSPLAIHSQDNIPDEILNIFDSKCAFAGCHAGASPSGDLDLTEEQAFSSLVNQPSRDFVNIPRVKAGDPLKSYLLMKLVGTSGIKGERMPKGDQPLSKVELKVIAAWIKSIPKDTQVQAPTRKYAESFPGLSVATLQTAETMEKGLFSYRIAHRWLGKVDGGFGQFFGLDAGAHMLTEFSFPIWTNLTFTLGRSGTNATFEFNAKWQLLREKTDGAMPISAAIFGGVDWLTFKQIIDPQNPGQFLSRKDGERFQWYGQLILTKRLSKRISLLLSPGLLLNGNVTLANEDPIFTLGYAGKVMLFGDLSVFVEGAPILSGVDGALPVGSAATQSGQSTVYDAFTIGLEHRNGGHVFHLYLTNSLGLTTSQVMSGGNLDFANGDFRLGFNIYRALRLP